MGDSHSSSTGSSSPPLRIAMWLFAIASAIPGIVFTGIVTFLSGFTTFDRTAPVPAFVESHPILSMLIVGGLLLASLAGWVLARRPHARLVLSAAFPIIGYLLFGLLLVLVLVHPGWCPTSLCPAPQVVTNAHGVNDGTLEVYPTAVQSTAFVMPGDPSQYSLGHLPHDIAVLRIDGSTPASPYRAVVGVHSLLRSGYSIFIERVEVLVDQVPVTPNPLNVFVSGPSISYQSNVYTVLYGGEDAGAALPAVYQTVPLGHPLLAPGEADNLDLQLTSTVPADIRFRVRVTYRVANEGVEHSLTLPTVFEVVFGTSSNWHPYELVNGQLIPSP